ncbi:hypothetical protein [Streptomyces macrosporus]
MSRGTRTGAMVAAGLLAGTALVGCGTDGGGENRSTADRVQEGSARAEGREDAAEVVRTAHEKTVAAETAKMTLRLHAASGGQERTVTGSGSIDLADGTSDLTIRVGGETIRQRVVDQALYQKLPESLRDRVSDGKPWIRIDLREAAGRIEGVNGVRISDPARAVDYARALSDDDATRIGRERIDGVDTTHYRVTVDVEDLAGEDTAQGERLRRQLGESLPMDLWLDDRDRIRRQQFEIEAKGAGGPSAESREPGEPDRTRSAAVRTVLEFHDFGTPVDVSAPPAGQTTDVTDRFVRPSGESPAG